jgi:hypothetical protein
MEPMKLEEVRDFLKEKVAVIREIKAPKRGPASFMVWMRAGYPGAQISVHGGVCMSFTVHRGFVDCKGQTKYTRDLEEVVSTLHAYQAFLDEKFPEWNPTPLDREAVLTLMEGTGLKMAMVTNPAIVGLAGERCQYDEVYEDLLKVMGISQEFIDELLDLIEEANVNNDEAKYIAAKEKFNAAYEEFKSGSS